VGQAGSLPDRAPVSRYRGRGATNPVSWTSLGVQLLDPKEVGMSAQEPAASRNVPTPDPAPVPGKPSKQVIRVHAHPILRLKRRLARI
jgi:hypothetical protein